MKSIYKKITLILTLGFMIQISLIAIFYKHFVLNSVINQINKQESYRQEILDDGIKICSKYKKSSEKLSLEMNAFSEKNKVKFIFKDVYGNTLYANTKEDDDESMIREQGYIKVSGNILYIVQCYFKPRVYTAWNQKERLTRGLIVFFIILLMASCLYLIYRTLTKPIKNLSRAIKNINYGNTIFKIPYKSEDEFGLLCRNFEEMGIRLKESEESQRQLILAMSHDIKTPLTSIMGYSKRLMEGKVHEERKQDYYETIYRKSIDLRSLINELDEYANINGENKYSFKKIPLEEYYNKIVSELKNDLSYNNMKLTYKEFVNDTGNNTYIYVDERQIKRIFNNIIENSFKYAGEDCTIFLSARAYDKTCEFIIKDDGPGVPKEQIGKIFERFYRLDTSRSREKGGTGLGLSICKEIIQKNNGTIEAINSDEGLCIKITIPLCL